MWSGSISFGLVNVPVKLYPVLQDRDIHFHMMSKDGTCRLRRKLVCPETGEEYDFKDTVKGYEVSPDQYVIVNDEELKSLKPEASRAIDIKHFVELDQIDPVYYDRPYYLLPDENGAKAFQLLHEAMRRARKVGIATFVMRGKEYLAAIRPMGDLLCLATMNFADEVIPPDDMPAPAHAKIDPKQLQIATKLIEALETDFDPEEYHSDYRERVTAMIEKKSRGEHIVVQAAAAEKTPRLKDLMKALEASVAQAKRGSGSSNGSKKSARGERAKPGRAEESRRGAGNDGKSSSHSSSRGESRSSSRSHRASGSSRGGAAKSRRHG